MASENIGALFNTQMPGYEDAADIQAALRLYHYGSLTYDPQQTDPSQIPGSSVAGYLQSFDDRVTTLEGSGIGSSYLSAVPSTPVDGEIWVDSTSTAQVLDLTAYTPTTPTDWDGSPTTIYEALDELASRLRVIEGV